MKILLLGNKSVLKKLYFLLLKKPLLLNGKSAENYNERKDLRIILALKIVKVS